MKHLLAAVIGLAAVGMAAPAIAADVNAIPYANTRTYIPVVYDWAGFYIGANGGYGNDRSCWDLTSTGGSFIARDNCHNASGAVAGAQLGYRWNGGPVVFGLEASGGWANLRGSSISSINPALTNRTSVDAVALFTGQVGYAWDNTMVYLKGGAALTDDRYEVRTTSGNTVIGKSNSDYARWGGTAGVGIEYGFATNWSAAVEYDRLFMQSRLTSFTPVAPSTIVVGPDRVRQDVDLVTVRVNYRWGGPVIGKY